LAQGFWFKFPFATPTIETEHSSAGAMARRIALAAVSSFAVANAVDAPPDLAKEFADWKTAYGKEYPNSSEENHRFEVWSMNHVFVNMHNAEEENGMHPYRVHLNHLADLTNEEYRAQMLGGYKVRQQAQPSAVEMPLDDAPDSWDWRSRGIVNDVKNQARCGSCWAFSAVAAMEGAYNLKNKGNVASECAGNTCGPEKSPCCSFSEQELVDCVRDGADKCNRGGNPADGVSEIAENRKGFFDTEKEYPYTSGGGQSLGVCHAKKSGAVQTGITGFKSNPQGDEASLKVAASKNVMSIGIDASHQSFQLYHTGVYVEPACSSTRLDHGVAIVGYGTGAGGDYWIVRNSWGSTWGMDGYIHMARDKNNQCGVATDAIHAQAGVAPPTPPAPPGPPPTPTPPPAPSGKTHYEKPPCRSDEHDVRVQGLPGHFCSPSCGLFTSCPSDVPSGVTARPQCALRGPSGQSCALICNPSADDAQCGEGTCQPIQGMGICTYADGSTQKSGIVSTFDKETVEKPLCSIWGIVGCGAAAAAAAAACGGPIDPADSACILAALAAIPGCGPCVCSTVGCPGWCPCSDAEIAAVLAQNSSSVVV